MLCRRCKHNRIVKAGVCAECYEEYKDLTRARRDARINARAERRDTTSINDHFFGSIWFWLATVLITFSITAVSCVLLDAKARIANSMLLGTVSVSVVLLVLGVVKMVMEAVIAQDFAKMKLNPWSYLYFHSLFASYRQDWGTTFSTIAVLLSLLALTLIHTFAPALDYAPLYLLIGKK